MQIMRKWLIGVLTVVTMMSISSCDTTRYVPDDAYLLNSTKLKVEGSYGDISTGMLSGYLRQTPNTRWFSLLKLPLYTYSLSGRDSSWISRTLRSMGEAPVIYDERKTLLTCNDLRQELRNEGYLHADVHVDTVHHGKKMNVTYGLQPGEPYFIHNLNYDIEDEQIASLLKDDAPRRLLRSGMKFNVAQLDAERKRLTSLLTDNGYFRFHKEFITYQADTARNSRLVNVRLHLGLFRQNNQPDTLHTRYTMRHVTWSSGNPSDPHIHLRKSVLRECTHLSDNQYYTSSGLQNTYNHFGRLQAVKYTNINFAPVEGSDSLDCDIQLLTNKPSTISFQPEGTNTSGDLGAAATLTYQNRNLFRGSEVLSLEFRGAYEAIRGLEGYSNQDFVEYSTQARLQFPRFVAPFISPSVRQQINATSELSLLYDLQNRPEFHRRLLSAAWRYRWNNPQRHDRFQLDLLDLNYLSCPGYHRLSVASIWRTSQPVMLFCAITTRTCSLHV